VRTGWNWERLFCQALTVMDLAKPVFMIAGSWGKEPTEEVEGTEIHFAEPNLSQFDFRRGGFKDDGYEY